MSVCLGGLKVPDDGPFKPPPGFPGVLLRPDARRRAACPQRFGVNPYTGRDQEQQRSKVPSKVTRGVNALGAKTHRPNRESALVTDIEGGRITDRDLKAAREVLQEVMGDRDFQRLNARRLDEIRDQDTSLTRATRDRDRATPRDVSQTPSARLRGDLPVHDKFRGALSARQRKLRSVIKNQVMAAAPAAQRRAVNDLLIADDPKRWRDVNGALHRAAGDAQKLDEDDRKLVQRLDRTIQGYERLNDRTHTVYVSVQLPDTHRDVYQERDLPTNLRPGAGIVFDQFTLTRHNLREIPGYDSRRHLVFEIATNRGMYFGRSDSVEDTTHLLPRGMRMQIVAAHRAIYETSSGGFDERLVLQVKEIR